MQSITSFATSIGLPSAFDEYGLFCRVHGSSSPYQSICGVFCSDNWLASDFMKVLQRR